MKRYLLPALLVAGALLISGCQNNSTSSSASTPDAAATGNPSSAVTLQESGSSLLYPFLWAAPTHT